MNPSAPSIEALAERLTRLEAECARLARQNRSWRRTWVVLATSGVCVIVLGLGSGRIGGSNEAQAQDTSAPYPAPKRYVAEQFLLQHADGKLMGAFAMDYRDGTSSMSLHGRDQAVRLWLRVGPDGEPGIIFFGKDGQDPYELIVSHQGQPQLRFRRPPFQQPQAPAGAPAAAAPPGGPAPAAAIPPPPAPPPPR